MAFESHDLVLALVTHQEEEGQWAGMVGARSCGGTQGDCPNMLFDHIASTDEELTTLRDVLQTTLDAVNAALGEE